MVEFKEYEGLGYFIDPESDTKTGVYSIPRRLWQLSKN